MFHRRGCSLNFRLTVAGSRTRRRAGVAGNGAYRHLSVYTAQAAICMLVDAWTRKFGGRLFRRGYCRFAARIVCGKVRD